MIVVAIIDADPTVGACFVSIGGNVLPGLGETTLDVVLVVAESVLAL